MSHNAHHFEMSSPYIVERMEEPSGSDPALLDSGPTLCAEVLFFDAEGNAVKGLAHYTK